MSRRHRFLRYDLFKLVVVLLLLMLLYALARSPQPAASQGANATPKTLSGATGLMPVARVPAITAPPTRKVAIAPTATPTGDAPDETAPARQEPSPTAQPTQTASQAELSCPLALASRLKVGDRVRVVSTLYLRSAPEISSNLIETNPPGTQLEIVDGPRCIPFEGAAHLWWQVRREDGLTGWSAEGSARDGSYFIEPVQP